MNQFADSSIPRIAAFNYRSACGTAEQFTYSIRCSDDNFCRIKYAFLETAYDVHLAVFMQITRRTALESRGRTH